jgi:hypothetical protein
MPSHGGNPGSNPGIATKSSESRINKGNRNENHLPQAPLGIPPNGETLAIKLYGLGVFHEGLPPHFDERVLKRRGVAEAR